MQDLEIRKFSSKQQDIPVLLYTPRIQQRKALLSWDVLKLNDDREGVGVANVAEVRNSTARGKGKGDEVGWWIIFLSPAARVSCLWRAFPQA